MRSVLAAVLVFEAILLGLAILVAMATSDVSNGLVGGVGGGLALGCLAVAGLVRRKIGVIAGSILQAACVVSGVVVPVMYILGVVFALIWGVSLYYERKLQTMAASREQTD